MQLVGLGMTINIALLANSYWDMHALALYLLNFLEIVETSVIFGIL